jgi:hypothetical protein
LIFLGVEVILWSVQWRQPNYQALDLAPVRVTTKNKAYQILSPFHYSSILSGLSGRRFIHWNRLDISCENSCPSFCPVSIRSPLCLACVTLISHAFRYASDRFISVSRFILTLYLSPGRRNRVPSRSSFRIALLRRVLASLYSGCFTRCFMWLRCSHCVQARWCSCVIMLRSHRLLDLRML